MRVKSLVVGAIAAMSFSGVAHAGIIVDAFTASQQLTDTSPGRISPALFYDDSGDSLSSSVNNVASILGGWRHVTVNATKNTATASKDAHVDVTGGEFSFSTESGLRGYSIIRWNGNASAASTSGLGGIDLTLYGNAFQTETIGNDLGFNFTIQVWSAGGSSLITLPATIVQPSQVPGVFSTIPFGAFGLCGSFATCTGAGADFTAIGAIEVVLNFENVSDISGGVENLDLRIGPITTVPEPSVLALLGAAGLLAGGVSLRRRRQR